MPTVELQIPALGSKFKDYRMEIYGNSYTFGPLIYAPNVQFLTFHHSVTKQTAFLDGDWKAECNQIAKTHVDSNGWAGIGYHFVICSDGTVAYVSDLSHGAANVKNHNDINFGACMVGDFTKHLPTDEQIRSANILAWHFLENMPSFPALQINSETDKLVHFNNHIRGHKDWYDKVSGDNNTQCPGSSWPNDMKNRIKYGIVYTPKPPEPPKLPEPENPKQEEIKEPEKEVVIVATTNESNVKTLPAHNSEATYILSENPTNNTPLDIKEAKTLNEKVSTPMRHVDYFKAIIRFIIKILNTKIL